MIVILGAGPAGIGAALSLGPDAVVLERARDAAGLAGTIPFEGAIFDTGGHSFHTPHAGVRDLVFGALDMFEQTRQARCWHGGRLIDYPFQAHVDQIADPAIAAECARGLAAPGDGATPPHFEAYLTRRFGDGVARHFLLPYNRKLWGADLSRLAVGWTAERIAAPAATRDGAGNGRRQPLGKDTVVAYPAQGGFGEIFLALARRIPHLRFDRQIAWIDPIRRALKTVRGETLEWHRLVSTLALPDLASLLTTRPAWLLPELRRLEAIALALVMVVVDGPVGTPVQRVYSADVNCPAHKLVINHNSSPALRARPRHGIQAEVSLAGGEPADLEARVVASLAEIGLIRDPGGVHAIHVVRIPRGYPVPTHDRDAIVGRASAWLEAHGIHTAGRFGEWAYINSDEALHRGLTLGRRLRGE